MASRITPGVAPRLYFVVLDSTGEPVTDLAVADITSIAYRLITGGVAGATSSGLSLTAAVVTDAHSTGSTGPVRASDGWYFCDAPVGAADANADAVELVVVLDDGTRVVYPSVHEIDFATRTRSTFDHTSDEVTTDAASRTASQADVSGLVTQSSIDTIDGIVDDILVHTTELQANQGNWLTATGFSTHSAADVWSVVTRTLTSVADSAGIITLLSRIAALIETKAQADTRQTALITAIDEIEITGGGGDATEAKQDTILAAIQGAQIVQVPSPNVLGNLVLTQGDTYDGIGNARASWNVTTDYTDGWTVTFTVRDESDVVVYTTTGEVVSATVVAVAIDAPTGLTMAGCPGYWEGKYDVQLTKIDSVQTIAIGKVFINEDQTR